MSSGLDNIIKPIEVSKEDWVEYEGIMYPPNQARAKARRDEWNKRAKTLSLSEESR